MRLLFFILRERDREGGERERQWKLFAFHSVVVSLKNIILKCVFIQFSSFPSKRNVWHALHNGIKFNSEGATTMMLKVDFT